MKVLIINEVLGSTSTGKICAQLAEEYETNGHDVKVAYGRWGKVPEPYQRFGVRIGNDIDVKWHAIMTRLFDAHGFGSIRATKKFIKWLDEYNPDLVWLHNIHGYYLNIELLFAWLKKHPNVEKKWTLHDCWSMTGHCSHFTYVNCDKWKTVCGNCPQRKEYPKSILLDRSKKNYEKKKELFTGVSNLTIICPSKWLASIVKESYLNSYKLEIVHNKIDLSNFHHREGEFKQRNNIKEKMVLGVANIWNERKGLSDFYRLADLLGEEYKVVLVGMSGKQIRLAPSNVLAIGKTNGQSELAEIYSEADVFVNLTYEDTYPTVNLEAQACGTPCITYDAGGSPESVPPQNVVAKGDLEAVVWLIKECIA